MALFKEKISDNGIATKYHKIARVSLDNNGIMCIVESHVSKDYRDQNKDAVYSNVYHFTCSLEEEETQGIRQLCYAKLKELEEWQDSEDC